MPPDLPPVPVSVRLIAAVLAVAVILTGAFVIAWTTAVTDPTSHAANLDRLPVPSGWALVDSNVVRDPLLGSRVERYYVVDADPADLVDPAARMLQAGGFELVVSHAPSDWCTFTKVGASEPPWPGYSGPCAALALDPCSTNGPGGPMTCYLNAVVGEDDIQVVVFDRDQRTSYFVGSESHEVGAPGLAVVRVIDSWPGRMQRRPAAATP